MKRIIPIVIGLGILFAFAWTLWFLYKKSQDTPVVYRTERPFTADLIKKTVATGELIPRREVEIKPRVSGVIKHLAVEPGDKIETGDLIAEIQIIPDVLSLNRAESSVKAAQIGFENARRERDRYKGLFEQNIVPEAEYQRYVLDYELKRQELDSARSDLQLVKEGASKASGKISNEVRSTVAGMVLDVPVKLGESVIESNTFNAGTTIAFIADMNDMIFEGKVDESEVGKIAVGMPLVIKIGAIEERTFKGELEYISPKGVEEEGAIQFEIRAALLDNNDVFIRAGYSANADIVLDRRDQALAIREALLQFDADQKPYVEVATGPQEFERRDIEVGLSDGINIEIRSGLTAETEVKHPDPNASEQRPGRRGRGGGGR
jgi:HlyD family secretion protein